MFQYKLASSGWFIWEWELWATDMGFAEKLFPCCKLLIPLQDALNWKISGQVDGDPIYVKEVFNRTQEEN